MPVALPARIIASTEPRIVVGEIFFEPDPVWRLHLLQQHEQPIGKARTNLGSEHVLRRGGAIGVEPEQGECPGTRRGETLDNRQRLCEQVRWPSAGVRALVIVTGDSAQRPERASVAVLGSLRLEPATIKAHEVAEAAGIGVEGVLHEGGIGQDHARRAIAPRRAVVRAVESSRPRALSSTQ